MINRAFHFWPDSWHIGLALLMSLFIGVLLNACIRSQENLVDVSSSAVQQVDAQLVARLSPNAGVLVPMTSNGVDAANWPLRVEVDELLRIAAETARAQGVSLRAISVSNQESSAQAWGRVALDVSASGRYPALKAWQSAMQKQYSSLAVHSLRLRGNESSSFGDSDAEVTWVLYVRD